MGAICDPLAWTDQALGEIPSCIEIKLVDHADAGYLTSRTPPQGEIWIRGPSVSEGYLALELETQESFTADGWFKTGDVGRFTEDGFLQIVDRKKDILVTAGGKNVPPANIELRFRDDPFIANVVVYGEAKKFLVAGVWLNEEAVTAHLGDVAPEGRDAARRALVQKRIDQANAEMASYETLKKFAIFTEALSVENELLTPSLKVRRKKVYERFHDQFEALYEGGPPADAGRTPEREAQA